MPLETPILREADDLRRRNSTARMTESGSRESRGDSIERCRYGNKGLTCSTASQMIVGFSTRPLSNDSPVDLVKPPKSKSRPNFSKFTRGISFGGNSSGSSGIPRNKRSLNLYGKHRTLRYSAMARPPHHAENCSAAPPGKLGIGEGVSLKCRVGQSCSLGAVSGYSHRKAKKKGHHFCACRHG